MKNQTLDIDLLIESAQIQDIPRIFNLIKIYSDKGILLPRSRMNICDSLKHFHVVKKNELVLACGALVIYTKAWGEIRSLAVDPSYIRSGLGQKIVKCIEQDAKKHGLVQLIAITYVSTFFEKLGFQTVDLSDLPHKLFGDFLNIDLRKFRNCEEIAVLKSLNSMI